MDGKGGGAMCRPRDGCGKPGAFADLLTVTLCRGGDS